MSDSRILVGAPATLTAAFYDGGEALVDPGTVTVTVTRSDGTAVVTGAATVGTGAAARTYTLAAQTRLDHLTAVWTGSVGARTVTTRHEVAGGFYADLAEIRALDALANTTSYPTAKLELARAQAEDRFEEATGVAWVRRHARDILSGTGYSRIMLNRRPPRSLIAATIDGTVAADLTLFRLYDTGAIERAGGATWPKESAGGGGNLVVEYVHGYDAPPWDLKQAFLTYVRYLLLDTRSRIPDRATAMTTEFGTIQLASATSRATLIPEVDAVLADHDRRIPGMAVV
jgi:hypothetical protein